MSQPSKLEQQMLALINAERTSRGMDALAFDPLLNDASEDHSSWMLTSGSFSHTGSGGTSSHERMKDAGYAFEGAWRSAENIAFQSERGASGYSDDVAMLHDALMNSAGHRANILNPQLTEIGIGIVTGSSPLARGYDSVVVTQNFAHSTARDPVVVEFRPAPDPVETRPSQVVLTPQEPTTPTLEVPAKEEDTTVVPFKTLARETPDPQSGSSKKPAREPDLSEKPDATLEPGFTGKFAGMLSGWQKAAEKFQSLSDAWQVKSDANPSYSAVFQARADKWQAKVTGMEVSMDRWLDKKSADWSQRGDLDGAAQLKAICDEIDSWNVSTGAAISAITADRPEPRQTRSQRCGPERCPDPPS